MRRDRPMYIERMAPAFRSSYIFDLLMESANAASEIVSSIFGAVDGPRSKTSPLSAFASEYSREVASNVLAVFPCGSPGGDVEYGLPDDRTSASKIKSRHLLKIPRFIPRTRPSRAD